MCTPYLKTSCATVAKFKGTDEYDSNIHALLRFLGRAGERGYTFSIAQHEGLIPAINNELVEMSRKRGKKVQIVAYEDPEDNDITFVEQLRRAAPESDALIVTGLDSPLRERPYFIDALNFSREAFHEIGKPILFWLTQESLAFIGNRAVDFYTQRSMMTVEFEHTPEINAPALELERRFRDETYRSKEDYEALKTRVNLLKKQLAEALDAEIPRRRIAQDIVLPLAKTYSALDLYEEALGLLEQFQEDWDEGDARELYERGVILSSGKKQMQAIAYLEKAQELLVAQEDLVLWADVVVSLGDLLLDLGRLDSALGYYSQNLGLREKVLEKNPDGEGEKDNLGNAFNRLGGIYKTQGKLGKALELFEKGLQIREELYAADPLSESLKGNLATSYNRLGGIYETQGKLGKALDFFEKGLQIREELYAANPLSESLKNYLGVSYNRLGNIYETQGNLGRALDFFEKNLQIREELYAANPLSEDLKSNLATSYNRLGGIYKTQGKLGKALELFEKDLQIREELYAANPLSESLKNNLATSYSWLGGIYETQGKLGKALDFFEKNLLISEELYAANPLSEVLKSNLANSYVLLSSLNARLGRWYKSIRSSWKGMASQWQACQYVGWKRHKFRLFNSLSLFLSCVFLPPPILMIVLWLGDKIDLLYKRLRYSSDKPTLPPTSLS